VKWFLQDAVHGVTEDITLHACDADVLVRAVGNDGDASAANVVVCLDDYRMSDSREMYR
jgi:hypothetical protein